MKTLLFVLFSWFLLANNCANSSQKTQQNKEEFPPLTEQTIKEAPEGIEKNEQGGWEEFEGNRIVKGELYTSKGAILGIAGVFISEDYKADSDNKQLPKLRPLVGKTLEVKGDVYTYYCGPIEQCLTEGSMKWMRNVEYVKVLE